MNTSGVVLYLAFAVENHTGIVKNIFTESEKRGIMAGEQFEDIVLPEFEEENWHTPNDTALKKLAYRTKGPYMIEPLLYGIVEGDNRQGGGYTSEQWDVAYNNKIGIQAALDYAADNGYTEAILPKNQHYNTMYTNISGDIRVDVVKNGHSLIMPSGLIWNLNGSEISILWDSDNRNPYDNGPDYDPHRMPGHLVAFHKTYKSKIINGTLTGEMYERSWVEPTEKDNELNTGVWVNQGSAWMVVDTLTIKGFSGDCISTNTDHNTDFGNYVNFDLSRTLHPNFLNIENGSVSAKTGAYATVLLDITNLTSSQLTMRTGIGSVRTPEFVNQVYVMCWYDSDDNFLFGEESKFLKRMEVPENATQIKIGIYGEFDNRVDTDTIRIVVDSVIDNTDYTITINDVDYTVNSGVSATVDSVALSLKNSINAGDTFKLATVITDTIRLRDLEDGELLSTLVIDANMSKSLYKTYQITPPTPHGLTIKNCEITRGHRGGISNVCDDTVIKYNKFYDNGTGPRQGWPEFGVTTKYQINIEDVQPTNVTIKHNDFYDSFNTMLLSGHNVHVYANSIMNGSGVSVFNCENIYIYTNTFTSCTRAIGFTSDKDKRLVHFYDNNVYDTSFSDTSTRDSPNTIAIIRDNIVRSGLILYKANLAYAKNSPFVGIKHFETYDKTETLIHEMCGIFKDCEFHLTEPRYSTAALYLNAIKGTRELSIECSYTDKRITPIGSNYNVNIDGGTLYHQIGINDTEVWDFVGGEMNPSLIEFQNYGTTVGSVSNTTLNFFNTGFEFNTVGALRFFKFSTTTTNGETNVSLNIDLQGKSFKVGVGVGGDLFHFGHFGVDHNVTINLSNGIIDLSKTSENVDIGNDRTAATNNVIINKTNITILGTLNEVVPGYTIVEL